MAKEQKPTQRKKLTAAAKRPFNFPPQTAEDMVLMLLQAEERGEVERVALPDGAWAFKTVGGPGKPDIVGPDGQPSLLRPTPEMLALLERFEAEG